MSFIASLGNWLRKISTSFANASISGQNITLTRHNGDTVVLTTYAPSYSTATQSTDGLMSASDKTKLDGLVAYSGATTTSNGLVSTGDQTWEGSKTIANSSDSGWRITYGSGSSLQTMRFEIGNSHVNRGIWDDRLNKWVFHCDNSKCYVGGYSIEKSVPSNAEFTDTVTTVSTSGTGNAVTAITANNGQLSVTKGASFFPLNGGALTGTDIFRSEGNSRLFLSGGNAWNTGSQLWLQSKEVGDGITLTAMGSNGGVKSLLIKPDGTLSWDGKDISRLLTNTQSTGSRTSAVESAAQFNYTIANNVVWLWIYVTLTSQAARWSDTKICTNLPAPASRNHGNMCGAAVQYDGNYGNPAYFIINDSGELHLINRGTVIAANTAVWGFLSYPRGY